MSIRCQSNLAEPEYGRAIKIRVFDHGDIYNRCYDISINPNHLRTWNSILQYLTNTINPSFGAVRKLISVKSKKCIWNFKDLEAHRKYIAVRNTNQIKLDRNRYKTSSELEIGEYSLGNKTKKRFYSTDLDIDKFAFLHETKKKKRTIIFILVSGRIYQTPSKVVLTTEDLFSWNMILRFLSNKLDVPDGIQHLCTIYGDIITDPLYLQHGCLYIAIPFNEKFRKMNYMDIFNASESVKRNHYELIIRRAHNLGGSKVAYYQPVTNKQKSLDDPRVNFNSEVNIAATTGEYEHHEINLDEDSVSNVPTVSDTTVDKKIEVSNDESTEKSQKKPSYILIDDTVIIGTKKYLLISDNNGEFAICQRDQICQSCISDENANKKYFSFSEVNYYDLKNNANLSTSQETYVDVDVLPYNNEQNDKGRSISRVMEKTRTNQNNNDGKPLNVENVQQDSKASLAKWVSGYLEEELELKIGEDEEKTDAETLTEYKIEEIVSELSFCDEKLISVDEQEDLIERENQVDPNKEYEDNVTIDESSEAKSEIQVASDKENAVNELKKQLSKHKRNGVNGGQFGKNMCLNLKHMQPIYIRTKMDINLCNLAKSKKKTIYSGTHEKSIPGLHLKCSLLDSENYYKKGKMCCFCINKNETKNTDNVDNCLRNNAVKGIENLGKKKQFNDVDHKVIPPTQNTVIISYATNGIKANSTKKDQNMIEGIDSENEDDDCDNCNCECGENICHNCSCISVDSIDVTAQLAKEKIVKSESSIESIEDLSTSDHSMTVQMLNTQTSCMGCTCSGISLDSIDED